MKKVSVIGAGSWGSALAVLLANNGHEVTLWTHDPHEIEMLSTKREQVEKLPGVKLPDNIMIEADLKTALTDEDVGNWRECRGCRSWYIWGRKIQSM